MSAFRGKADIARTRAATNVLIKICKNNPNPTTVRRCGFRNRHDGLYSSRLCRSEEGGGVTRAVVATHPTDRPRCGTSDCPLQ